MYGRRRRPILGAALVVGASRNAAKREVAAHEQQTLEAQRQRQYDEDRLLEKTRREQEDLDRRTAMAVDSAMAKERTKNDEKLRDQSYPSPARIPVSARGMPLTTESRTRYCQACGAVGKALDKFCVECGSKQTIRDSSLEHQIPPMYSSLEKTI